MKRILLLSFFTSVLISQQVCSQEIVTDTLRKSEIKEVYEEPKKTIEEKNNDALLFIAEHTRSEEYYKLYPTTNIWTFIKLDTRNGKLWQVQFNSKDEYRFQTALNLDDLTVKDEKAGSFELYPTQNIYNFLLLDKTSGRVWQVQWSTKKEERQIIRIY